MEPGTEPNNAFDALRIVGPLNVEALENNLNEIIWRHEYLSTSLCKASGHLRLDSQDLCAVVEAEREAVAALRASEEGDRPFDLQNGPLLRVSLLRLAAEDHVLVLSMHSSICEGARSMAILMEELQSLYHGRPMKLPRIHNEELQRDLSYWRKQLQGVKVLDLPTDRPGLAEGVCQSARENTVLPQDLSERLRVFSRQEGLSLFTLMLASFQTLLHRYSGQNDICVGSPVTNWTGSEAEDLAGLRVNAVAMRTDFSGEPSFKELLKRVRVVVREAQAHQRLPLERLVQELQLDRSGTHPPLFQVMFTFRDKTPQGVRTGSIFDLTLSVDDRPGEIAATLEFRADLFDGATARRMLGHYRTLLGGAVDNPDQPVSHISMLDDAERRQLLVDWNDTNREYSRLCVHQLFEEQAERTPHAVAVVCDKNQWTYHDVNTRANQLARYLQAQGIGPEVLVGVCCARSLDLVVGILAVLKAGGAYVPLDPGYPTERLAFMLDDAQVKLLLTQVQLAARLPLAPPHFYLDRDWDRLAGEPTTNPAGNVQPDNLAYVLYTSGSTGKPKGAEILHRGLTNYLSWAVETYAVAQGEGAPVHSSISFDATISSFFTPLLAGKKVVLLPERDEIEALGALLQSEADFSLVKITPAHLDALSHLLPESAAANGARSFVIGGEALFGKQLAYWQAHAPHTRMVNEYGPTETVVGCCVYEATRDHPWTSAVPIGRPIANTQLYVLDDYLQPTPLGVPGELYIGGAGVARGYHNRPELTAEKFLANPFGPGRIYRTGDLVRYLPDGNLVYLGRLDDQVKIRGFRVELGEVETVLTQHPAVREAAVVSEKRNGQQRLVAYIVPGPSRPSTADLRTYLGAKLPDYMLPSVFIVVEAMPLTPNGKVDRRSLSAAEPSLSANDCQFIDASSEFERRLKEIWERLLAVQPIGIRDNFFDLGGQSLLAVRLFSEIRSAFGVQLPLATILRAPTIESLARVVAKDDPWEQRASLVQLTATGHKAPIFCIGPLSGEVILFQRLALELGPDQPLFGLQPFAMADRMSVLSSVEDVAAYYLEKIRASGKRPGCLLGCSIGGLVALEMAQQLRDSGEDVPLVALIDTHYTFACRAQESWDDRIRRYQYHARNLANRGFDYLVERARTRSFRMLRRVASVTGTAPSAVGNIIDALWLAGEAYRARPYPGRVCLFRAESRNELLPGGPLLGWGGILSNLTIEDLPGNHETVNTGIGLKMIARILESQLESLPDVSHSNAGYREAAAPR